MKLREGVNEIVALSNGTTYTIKKWMVWIGFITALGSGLGFAIDKFVEPIVWKTELENKVEKVEKKVDDHIMNNYIHGTYELRSKQFVPRDELEKEFKSMNEKLDIIIGMKR